jgi:predicted aspartyl protease
LTYAARINANLATNVYFATILWNGVERNVAVLAMGRRRLVRTALVQYYHLSIDFCEGGTFWLMRFFLLE